MQRFPQRGGLVFFSLARTSASHLIPFEPQADSLQFVVPLSFHLVQLDALRRPTLVGRAELPQRRLHVPQMIPHGIRQRTVPSQVNRTLAPGLAIAQTVEWSQPPPAVLTPSLDDRPLAAKCLNMLREKGNDRVNFLVNRSQFFRILAGHRRSSPLDFGQQNSIFPNSPCRGARFQPASRRGVGFQPARPCDCSVCRL